MSCECGCVALSRSIYTNSSQSCFLIQSLNFLTWTAPAACPLLIQPQAEAYPYPPTAIQGE